MHSKVLFYFEKEDSEITTSNSQPMLGKKIIKLGNNE